jgi:outer membrane protein assembly factor BamA
MLLGVLFSLKSFAQTNTTLSTGRDTGKIEPAGIDSSKQKDIADLLFKLLKSKREKNKPAPNKKLNISVIPSAGYTLTTGFAADLTGNAAFFTTSDHHENPSVVDGDLSYDVKFQKIFVSRSEIWTNNNKYKFTSDIRWQEFPEDTYGIGTSTTPAQADPILFFYTKVYATLYRKLSPLADYYLGLGYNLDHHYNIKETGIQSQLPNDFKAYGNPSRTTSSGININFLYDSRTNTINPLNGIYANITYTQNLVLLCSNSNWESLVFDFRKYIKVSQRSNNVLALWGFTWFTRGNPPYLDLPYTGGDTFNNTGRGYIQGRFTGRNMLYLESEFRFGITRNGLFGGVVFANAESLTEFRSNAFETVAPAAGAGLRIKVNKHSNTNVCIDYGIGIHHSHGFFVNLGEVF